jgi:hypothetical protein
MPKKTRLQGLRQKLRALVPGGNSGSDARNTGSSSSSRRPAITLRVYRDVPIPIWKVVLPDKLLQFRPLDLLRLDIFGIAGLVAVVAQVCGMSPYCVATGCCVAARKACQRCVCMYTALHMHP